MIYFKIFICSIFAMYPFAVTFAAIPTAIATLESKSGSNVKGAVYFEETTNGVKVIYNIRGLTPNQKHGFHIHEIGDCSADNAMSAGKHYVAIAASGGTAADSPQKHAGDFPELKANKKGEAKGGFVVNGLTINNKNLIRDKAILVHGGPDDINKKAPPRVACGVIKLDRTKVNETRPENPNPGHNADSM